MAEKPVIVPVELQVTDIDTKSVDLKALQEDVSKKLSGLKKTIGDLFSGIDTSKMNKAITTSMAQVEKSVSRALTAQNRLDQAIVQAGRSSEVFKSKMSEVDQQIRLVKDQIQSLDSMNLGASVQPLRDQMVKELEVLEKNRAQINPADFVDTATPEAVLKVAEAYRKVGEAISEVNEKGKQFNTTVDQNNLTEEYTKQANKADELKTKLEQLNEKSKKMAEVGATDKQWESLQYDVKQVSSELDSTLRSMRKMVKEGEAFRFDAAKEDVKKLQDEIKAINATRINIAGNGKNKTGAVDARAQKNASPYTEDYKKQLADLQKLETAAQRLVEKYERMKALGKDSPEGLKAAEYDAQQLSGKLDEAKAKMTEMVNEGKAFKVGQGDPGAELSGLNSRIEETQNNLSKVQSAGNGLTGVFGRFISKISEAHPAFGKVVTAARKVGPVLSKIVSVGAKVGQVLGNGLKAAAKGAATLARGLGKVVSRLGGIISGAARAIKNLNLFHKSGNKTSGDLSKGFKKLQKNILMFGFGFRSAYYAIKRLRRIFTDAFKTLATQSDEVNRQISSLVMHLNRLKGSLATAFQPIATVVIPILNALMDKLSAAMETLGKFFATMMGQGYIYKAVANQYDFAASLDETGKSAEETEKKLGAYDKLDVIQDDKDSGNLLDVTYEKADVEGAASDFATMLKEAWKKQDFTEVGELLTEKLIGLLSTIENSFLPKFTTLVNKVANAITTLLAGFDAKEVGVKVGGFVNTLLSNLDGPKIGRALASIKSLIWQFLDGLVNNIDWANLGTTLGKFVMGFVESLDVNSVLNTIVGLINGIGTALLNFVSTIKWDEVGTKLATGLTNFLGKIDLTKVGTGLAQFISGLGTALLNFVSNINFKDIAQAIADGINAFIGNLNGKDVGDGAGKFLSGIVTFIAELISNINWDEVIQAFITIVDKLLTSVQESLENSDNPVLHAFGEMIGAIREMFETLAPIIQRIIGTIGPIIEAILPVLTTLFDALVPIIEVIADLADTLLPAIVSIIKTLMPIIQHIISKVLPILQEILTALQPIFEVIVNDILPIVFELLEAIMPLIDGILDLVVAILEPILSLITPLLKLVAKILQPIVDLLKPILDLVGYLFSALAEILQPILDLLTPLFEMLNAILEPIFSVLSVIFELLTPFIDIIKFIVGLITSVLSPVLNVLVGIFRVIADVVSMVGGVFSSVFKGISKAVETAWNVVKGVLNAILGGIETLTNGVIKGLNFMIRGLNKLSFDVPDWVPFIGGEKFGFNIKEISEVHIPRLAQGAVIPPNKEFLAMLGDQPTGTNIEAPLDTIKQALAEVLAEMGNNSGNHEPIILQIDGKTVAKVVWAEEEKRYKQTGRVSAFA